jgi:superfamily II DNA or RNA helicase
MTLGLAERQGDLLDDVNRFCEATLPENSIFAVLHRERDRLFPDEMFADLFSTRGRNSVPPSIVSTVMVLQRLQKIQVSTNYTKLGTIEAGGYVWHTTGSGKTLTSFKAARLVTRMAGVEKILFVVDRKDLDYQTMRAYDRFEKGAASSNTSTRVLNLRHSTAWGF